MSQRWSGKGLLVSFSYQKKTHDSVFEDHKDIKKACLANHTV